MKKITLATIATVVVSASFTLYADEHPIKNSTPIGTVPPLSKEETHKGVENGTLCSDINGLADSRGAVIKQDGKLYRCIKSYGENFTDNKRLVWVEVTNRNGELVTAD